MAATVWLYYCTFGAVGEEPRDILVATGTTAQDGSFSLEDPQRDVPGERWAGWTVCAHAPGLTLHAAWTDRPTEMIELVLEKPTPIVGMIRTDDGQPVVGASVVVTEARLPTASPPLPESAGFPDHLAEQFALRTDEGGIFEIPFLSRSRLPALRISAEAYGSAMVRPQADLTMLRLSRPGTLRGRLICQDKPDLAAGVRVVASGNVDGMPMYVTEVATSDAEGRFAFPRLQPGWFAVGVARQPGASHHVRSISGVRVKPGWETTVELVAERTAPVRGRAVAADSGEGIEGAEVRMSGILDNYETAGRTGPDGRFEIPCLPGVWWYDADHDGYVFPAPFAPVGERFVTVGPTGAAIPDIAMQRTHTLTLQVVDEKGQPVPDALVDLDSAPGLVVAGLPYLPGTGGRTDQNGTSRSPQLPVASVVVWVAKGNLGMRSEVTVQTNEGGEPVRLVLHEGAAAGIAVQVVDQHGEPVRDVQVELRVSRPRAQGGAPFGAGKAVPRLAQWWERPDCRPPDAEGRLYIGGLSPGLHYALELEAPGCDPVSGTDPWLAEVGVVHDFGTLTMQRATGVLAGTVVNEAGNPVPRAVVFSSADAPQRVTTITDEQGRFRLEGLRDGQAFAFVRSPKHRFTGVSAHTGTDDLTIRLSRRQPGSVGEPPLLRQRQMPPEEAKPLAKSLLLQALRETQGRYWLDRREALEELAPLDLDAAYLAAAANGEPVDLAYVAAGRAVMADDFEQGLALLRKALNSRSQVWGLLSAAHGFKYDRPELALQCVNEALALTAKGLELPLRQRVDLAHLTLDLDPERGQEIVRDLQQDALALGVTEQDARSRGTVAEVVCRVDPSAAVELVQPLPDDELRAYYTRQIALRLARVDPDRALELLEALPQPPGGGILPLDALATVVGTVDGQKAIEIADRLDPYSKEQALAVALAHLPAGQFNRGLALARDIWSPQARALALTRLASVAPRERAAEVLQEASAAAVSAAEEFGRAVPTYFAEGMARVAHIAWRLGYERHGELALRAVSMSASDDIPQTSDSPIPIGIGHFGLAHILAFSSPEMTRHVIQSQITAAGGIGELPPSFYAGLAAAAAEVDAHWAVELLEEMNAGKPQAHASAALAIAGCLLDDPRDREWEVCFLRSGSSWLPAEDNRFFEQYVWEPPPGAIPLLGPSRGMEEAPTEAGPRPLEPPLTP